MHITHLECSVNWRYPTIPSYHIKDFGKCNFRMSMTNPLQHWILSGWELCINKSFPLPWLLSARGPGHLDQICINWIWDGYQISNKLNRNMSGSHLKVSNFVIVEKLYIFLQLWWWWWRSAQEGVWQVPSSKWSFRRSKVVHTAQHSLIATDHCPNDNDHFILMVVITMISCNQPWL